MKNKRTFLASLALGIFLLATVSPIISTDNQEIGVRRGDVKTTGKQ